LFYFCVQDFIAGMASFLERCHSEWLQYVDEQRHNYPELNTYTVEQLVFLQQQLVTVGFQQEIDVYVIYVKSWLLSSVRTGY
jgi:hypothetical protein